MDARLQITLTQTSDGQVNIKTEGPGANVLTEILGLLEFAKHSILASHLNRQPQPEILPGALLPRNGRR